MDELPCVLKIKHVWNARPTRDRAPIEQPTPNQSEPPKQMQVKMRNAKNC